MPFVTRAGLAALDAYKYASGGYSWLDNMMNPYWLWCVELLPMWLAPNLVTAIGTMASIFHHIVVLMYSTNFEDALPWWVNVMGGCCLFFYNTMDSIDGKQARRTGSSSPLGQLFDHGCDGFQTLIITLSLCAALRLGPSWTLLAFLTTIQFAFFLAQWEEYHLHSIRTHVGVIGVTEGQYLSVFLFLITGVLPDDFWTTPIVYDIPPNQALVGMFLLSQVWVVVSFLHNTLTKAKDKFMAASQLFPLVVGCGIPAFFLYIASNDDNSILKTNPRLVFFSFGLLNAYLITVMIVMNLCRQPYPVFPPALLVAFGVLANTFGKWVPASWALTVFLCFTALCYVNFVVDSISTITDHLGIYCFKVGKRPRKSVANKD